MVNYNKYIIKIIYKMIIHLQILILLLQMNNLIINKIVKYLKKNIKHKNIKKLKIHLMKLQLKIHKILLMKKKINY